MGMTSLLRTFFCGEAQQIGADLLAFLGRKTAEEGGETGAAGGGGTGAFQFRRHFPAANAGVAVDLRLLQQDERADEAKAPVEVAQARLQPLQLPLL